MAQGVKTADEIYVFGAHSQKIAISTSYLKMAWYYQIWILLTTKKRAIQNLTH